jgi:hypothetical protein
MFSPFSKRRFISCSSCLDHGAKACGFFSRAWAIAASRSSSLRGRPIGRRPAGAGLSATASVPWSSAATMRCKPRKKARSSSGSARVMVQTSFGRLPSGTWLMISRPSSESAAKTIVLSRPRIFTSWRSESSAVAHPILGQCDEAAFVPGCVAPMKRPRLRSRSELRRVRRSSSERRRKRIRHRSPRPIVIASEAKQSPPRCAALRLLRRASHASQ